MSIPLNKRFHWFKSYAKDKMNQEAVTKWAGENQISRDILTWNVT